MLIGFSPINLLAQDTIVVPLKIQTNDSLNFNFIDKTFLQPFKFKKNRDRLEKERVYDLIQKLIRDGDLRISDTVLDWSDIIKVLDAKLDSISIRDSTKIALLDNNQSKIDSLLAYLLDSSAIDFDTLGLNEKKDSLKTGDLVYPDREKLLKLRSILSTNVDPCIQLNKKIIGWHDLGAGFDYKNYNFNYLSVINLNGFELDERGDSKYSLDLVEINNIINFSQQNCTDVYLTIHNASEDQISGFLKNSEAQDRFVETLDGNTFLGKLNGVNIYFENINPADSELFVKFVKKLNNKFKQNSNQFAITISIPAVFNKTSLKKISAYNFVELNPIVDHYIVLTNNMIELDSLWAGPKSPLKSNNNLGFGSIESSVDFYSNGKIPVSKLIVSVSYLGIEWPVIDSLGKVKLYSDGIEVQYNSIQDSISKYRRDKTTFKQNFDSTQAVAYLDIRRQNFEPGYTQIWYENSQSLKMKYEWVIENNLAGVSIVGLGYDDGYTDLWDVLGLTFIDTIPINFESNLIKDCDARVLGIDNLMFSNIKINFNKELAIVKEKVLNYSSFFEGFQDYDEEFKSNWFGSEFISDLRMSAAWVKFKSTSEIEIESKYKPLLKNKETCICLIERWYVYAYLCFFISIIIGIIIVYYMYIINRFNRFRDGILPSTYEKYRTRRALLTIPWLLFLYLGWFLYPNYNMIMANEIIGVNLIKILVVICVGAVVGFLITYSWYKGSYIKKDLP